MISMTGFAAQRGAGAGHSWTWDLRSVNGKGFDLRLRLPDWIDGLELALRAEVQKLVARGYINLTLKLAADDGRDATPFRLNPATLTAALAALGQIEGAARASGVALTPPSAADVLALRGILDAQSQEVDTAPLRAFLLDDLPTLLADFSAMRAAEGAALAAIIGAQLDRIAALTNAARAETANRAAAQTQSLHDSIARVLAVTDAADPARLAQELALIAVKTDITEEVDRLTAHVTAARAHLADAGPVGRKLDFLVQEFMREANTLCSKAQSLTLTRIGLDLKTVIDQMREQVQNVE